MESSATKKREQRSSSNVDDEDDDDVIIISCSDGFDKEEQKSTKPIFHKQAEGSNKRARCTTKDHLSSSASSASSARLCCAVEDLVEETQDHHLDAGTAAAEQDDLKDVSSKATVETFPKLADITTKRFEKEQLERKHRPQHIQVINSLLHASSSSSNNGASTVGATPKNAFRIIDDDAALVVEIPSVSSVGLSKCPGTNVDVFGLQGRRPYMEDTYSVFYHEDFDFFGIYDGHGGSRTSEYAAANLHLRMMATTDFQEHTIDATKKALSRAFLAIDEEFLLAANREHLQDGSTAIVAVISRQELVVAWVGDSRAVLCRNGKCLRASEDHKPNRPDEKKRVEDRGGSVAFRGVWRVVGPTPLAVSRALGDRLMKNPPLVIAQPEFRHFPLSDADEFLVMATDGLWDVYDEQEVVDAIKLWYNIHGTYAGVAKSLADKAYDLGSQDNITVMIVAFTWAHPSHASTTPRCTTPICT